MMGLGNLPFPSDLFPFKVLLSRGENGRTRPSVDEQRYDITNNGLMWVKQ